MIELEEPFKTLWQGKNPFEEVENISGDVARAVATRRTLRFEVNGKGYYLKLHHGTTVGEIVKNLIRLRAPVLGANREWRAIHELSKIGVDTMTGVAFGDTGGNPLTRTSFIITEDLSPVCNLATLCRSWVDNPPELSFKRLIIHRVAEMVRKMHTAGINHRDCYLGHFLMSLPYDGNPEHLKISVIDLHRAQFHDVLPRRWRDKDLIALYYSAREVPLTRTDFVRFMKTYFQKDLHKIIKEDGYLYERAKKEVIRIRQHTIKLNAAGGNG